MPEYSAEYFKYQRVIGEFGGAANQFKFSRFVEPGSSVLDYGCGGGYLLANIAAKSKSGVEPNNTAAEAAQSRGVNVYHAIDDVPRESIDLIISNHALEHVERPLDSIRDLRSRLKSSQSKAVFVVPHEGVSGKYRPEDPNQHLYTWNPLTLGNLFVAAGYENPEIDLIRHKWPRGYLRLQRRFGWRAFHIMAGLNAYATRDYQLRIVARRGNL